jgi:large subunit ribosomal protein L5
MENTPLMKKLYNEKVLPELQKDLGLKNSMAVPKLVKIVVNAGLGLAKERPGLWEQAMRDLALICGQKPAVTRARKSVAGFKLRRGMLIGQKITLRGNRMYDFLARFLNVAVPRIRDFRGFSASSVDRQGNFSFGIAEHSVFPEIAMAEKEQPFSLQVTIVSTAGDYEKGRKMLEKFGFPFSKEKTS